MAAQVTIANLKSIKNLIFEVPQMGAFVITGANGCGKTSLLTVLHRMGAPNAFQLGLPGGKASTGIDGIADATITYTINNKSVAYRYNKIRWSATPKSNSQIVRDAFREVLFLKANASRVEPTQEELKGLKKMPADQLLREFMNAVFDTDKFDNLYKINLRGRGLVAHLIDRTPGEKKKTWYSEKAFSLGELCVMRLGQKLLAMKNGGLYIVDEFEMALHPAAQVRLFKQIEKLSNAAPCTVLVSTHSSSLIKSVSRKNIIYLENEGGEVSIHRNVYPTYALQHLALDEENSPDRLIFIEDVSAKQCVDELWKQHLSANQANGNRSQPTVQTAVIGGYKEVLRFLERSKSFVPALTRRMAALDADSKEKCLPPEVAAGQEVPILTVPQELYRNQRAQVEFLPWTPEVGLCDLLAADTATHRQGIQAFTGTANLQIPLVLARAHQGLAGKAMRDECKRTVHAIACQIAERKAWSHERAHESLMGYLVHEWLRAEPDAARALSGRLFN
ncbi:AAA ATPase domain protein [Burkholderia pseudomallei MSHR62]|uniref:ATP-dependent nuclease n=1 Tax=Burkholderia pseudomallei TaxID=28450 RepID=UPI00052A3915|nr:AAA family ATPase [Burkholderia pseudomallei]AIV72128.1 AAA ATPase domain protein [Burkholderia pseudomallei MSHR62]